MFSLNLFSFTNKTLDFRSTCVTLLTMHNSQNISKYTCTCKLYNIHTAWYADTNLIYSGYGKMYYDHIQLPLVASKHKKCDKKHWVFCIKPV